MDTKIMNTNPEEKSFERVWAMFEETDRRFKETDRLVKEVWKQSRETDRQIKETDKKFDKYFGKLRELDRNWGKLVEALVRPSVAKQFRERGIPVVGSGQQMERHRNGDTMEIDILLESEDMVIVVEVKTTLSVEDVNDHIRKHLEPFRLFFPRYQDKKILGAVAYIHSEENAHRYAYKKGLFVLTFTSGDMVEIQNNLKFVPREW